MYHLPTSCLHLFFLFSVFHHFSCAASKKELGWCETLFKCGNVTAGFPFSGRNRPEVCGHPSLELHCFKNKTSLIISNHLYDVLDINERSKTLRLSRAELRGSFCNATFTEATLPPEVFELSPTYKRLTVFYLCDRNLPYRSSYNCPGSGPVLVSQNHDYHNSCRASFTINVPKSFVLEEKELNVTHLESALSEGFDVEVKIDEKACQDCLSSHGTCGFENTTPVCCRNGSSSGCSRLHRPDASELHRLCSPSFSCGNQRGLSYPFWTPGREDCGHPDFKLECSSGFAELNISSVKFRILEATYTSRPRIIRLARSDYIGGLCPKDPLNATFDENVLPFAPNTEVLTIYYDCSQDFSRYLSSNVGDLACGDDDDRWNYYVTRNLSSLQRISDALNNFREFCGRIVSIPASGPTLNTLHLNSSTDNLKKALEEGFELELDQSCSRCTDSGGACGYNSSGFVCYYMDRTTKKGFSTGVIPVIEYTSGLVAIILIAGGLFCLISRRRETSDTLRPLNLKALIPLKHYSYAQVKIITKSFAEVVGKGGFGTVYRGTLRDGRSVAVKVLKDSKSNGEDFINEVASMSKTSHVNIVTLLGFCAEGSKRAILYEFLENGSLDKFISSTKSSTTDWRELYEIALGVARGLEYLHHGCRTRIVHFDIKPQNVLLDDKLCPKVSDFGLAKLCERKESILSLLDTRGTIGYIAPEVFSRVYGTVSHKSDVYSYGMLVLEMIGARTKTATDDTTSSTSSMYFPEWIYKDLEKEDNGKLIENGINSEDQEIVKKMTFVGLWCIQSWPSNRPPMNKVVEMMEGNLNSLQLPPKPVLQTPQVPLQESSMISEDISVYREICSMNAA